MSGIVGRDVIWNRWPNVALALTVILSGSLIAGTCGTGRPHTAGVSYQTGHIVAGVGYGAIKRFNPAGALLNTLSTGLGNSNDNGVAFYPSNNVYGTDFDGNTVSKFDSAGNILETFGIGYNPDPESIVVDVLRNAYVGQAGGLHQVLMFNASGTLLTSYSRRWRTEAPTGSPWRPTGVPSFTPRRGS